MYIKFTVHFIGIDWKYSTSADNVVTATATTETDSMQMTKALNTDKSLLSNAAANEISNPTQSNTENDIILEDNQNLP